MSVYGRYQLTVYNATFLSASFAFVLTKNSSHTLSLKFGGIKNRCLFLLGFILFQEQGLVKRNRSLIRGKLNP